MSILQHAGIRDKDSKTPLHHACEGGKIEIVVYLLEELKCDMGESIK